MLTPTLENGLRGYAIGPKVRALRRSKDMGLVELGDHTGLSPAMLSKIERGRLYPTLPTLLRIALVFSVGLDYFFMAAREKPVLGVVRQRERLRFSEKLGGREPAFYFESLDFAAVDRHFNAYRAELVTVAPERLRRHQHAGGELVFALQGSSCIHVGDAEHVLEEGDSMYFDPSVPHGYRRATARPARIIVVTSA